MTKAYLGGDFASLREAANLNRVTGGYVTPGAGVNCNVAAIPVGYVNGADIEAAAVTNLALTAGASAGQSVTNAVVVDNAGTVSAMAGVSALTGTQLPPTVPSTHALLALVVIDNGEATITQADINNKVRNFL